MREILVIDDDSSILEVLMVALQTEGFTVIGASSGQEALDLVARGLSPALVFCDLIMSEMSGGQFLSEFFKLRGHNVPVVLMSAVSFKPQIPGVTHLIQKPFDLETVCQIAATYCPKIPTALMGLSKKTTQAWIEEVS
jgi:CheY-like chemotaxis protein